VTCGKKHNTATVGIKHGEHGLDTILLHAKIKHSRLIASSDQKGPIIGVLELLEAF
jgi:hypothetical protein